MLTMWTRSQEANVKILYMMMELGPCSSRLEKGFTENGFSYLSSRRHVWKGGIISTVRHSNDDSYSATIVGLR